MWRSCVRRWRKPTLPKWKGCPPLKWKWPASTARPSRSLPPLPAPLTDRVWRRAPSRSLVANHLEGRPEVLVPDQRPLHWRRQLPPTVLPPKVREGSRHHIHTCSKYRQICRLGWYFIDRAPAVGRWRWQGVDTCQFTHHGSGPINRIPRYVDLKATGYKD